SIWARSTRWWWMLHHRLTGVGMGPSTPTLHREDGPPPKFRRPRPSCNAVSRVQPGEQPESRLVVSQSGRLAANPRRPAWEAGILPLNYPRCKLFTQLGLV